MDYVTDYMSHDVLTILSLMKSRFSAKVHPNLPVTNLVKNEHLQIRQ